MPGDNDRVASDGLPAYVASPTTQAKLKILELYLGAYALACKSAPTWYALDLFAGSGKNLIEGSSRELDGSPVIALNAHTNRNGARPGQVIAVERASERASALRRRLEPYGGRATVIPGDHEKRLDQALGLISERAPSFAVIDPEGFEVAWTTLERLAQFRQHPSGKKWKMEMLILFPSSSVARLREEQHWPLLDQTFGCRDWHVVLEKRFPRKQITGVQLGIFGDQTSLVSQPLAEVQAEEAARAWVELYAGRMESVLGYDTVLPIRMVASNGSTKYHLVFATDHPAGAKIMRDVRDSAPRHLSHLDLSASDLVVVQDEARPEPA